MAKDEKTSKEVARKASLLLARHKDALKWLRSIEQAARALRGYLSDVDAVAGSALTQRPDKKKARKK